MASAWREGPVRRRPSGQARGRAPGGPPRTIPGVSARPDRAKPASAAVALSIVRNGVTHDARVLRAAATLQLAGLHPVVGVVTDDARERRSVQQGSRSCGSRRGPRFRISRGG